MLALNATATTAKTDTQGRIFLLPKSRACGSTCLLAMTFSRVAYNEFGNLRATRAISTLAPLQICNTIAVEAPPEAQVSVWYRLSFLRKRRRRRFGFVLDVSIREFIDVEGMTYYALSGMELGLHESKTIRYFRTYIVSLL